MDWQGHNLHINDDVIHYYRNGNSGRTPLVFCHGFSDNGLCWYRVAERFTDQFDIYLLDARNHGQSSRGIASAQDMTQDVAAVITALRARAGYRRGSLNGRGHSCQLSPRIPRSSSAKIDAGRPRMV